MLVRSSVAAPADRQTYKITNHVNRSRTQFALSNMFLVWSLYSLLYAYTRSQIYSVNHNCEVTSITSDYTVSKTKCSHQILHISKHGPFCPSHRFALRFPCSGLWRECVWRKKGSFVLMNRVNTSLAFVRLRSVSLESASAGHLSVQEDARTHHPQTKITATSRRQKLH